VELGSSAVEDLGLISPPSDDHFWQDRVTLVTGASGLVGGWVVQRLCNLGASVVCVIRDWIPQSQLNRSLLTEEVAIVRGDVRDQRLLERTLGEYEVETVIHLAAQTIVGVANRNPVSTFETNVAGTWALLEACRRSPAVRQIVLASSDKAYGAQESLPYAETSPLQGRHPYDVSKSAGDLIAQAYAATYGLPLAISRCGNFYGGGDLNWSRVVPGTIRSVLRGKRPVIRSDGSLVRDYFYVEDGAVAYTLLAEKLASNPGMIGQAFNFSNEEPLSVLELVGHILSVMGSDLEPQILNSSTNEILRQYLSAAKARETLGWHPTFDLDTGLKRTIEWYRRFLTAEA
jgi:CDP-glucose 4,6-dehydratase